jgi:beta-lactamase regulating signal transducer with metallopeptidase domain/DUF4097 and DUF4098 domain-containing protein YvlB
LVAAIMWGVLKLMPRMNAATRYVCWWITLAAVVLLPLRTFLPGRPPQPSAVGADSVEFTSLATPQAGIRITDVRAVNAPAAVPESQPLATVPKTTDGDFRIHLTAKPTLLTIGVLWGGASAALLMRLVFGYRLLQHLKRSARPAPRMLQARLVDLRMRAGVRRRVRLLESPDAVVPMALGLFDPVILMPEDLSGRISVPDFDHVALHELAHLQRYDDWLNLLQQLLLVLIPIQPVVFWIDRQLVLEREAACDDWVIARGKTPRHYAASLTRIAELTARAPGGVLCSAAIGTASQLYRRVQRLLDTSRNAVTKISTRGLFIAAVAMLAVAVATSRAPGFFALADPATKPAEPATKTAEPETAPSGPGSIDRSFDAVAGGTLAMDIDRGNISVSGWNQNRVRIIVTQKGPGLAELLKHHQITMAREGDEIRVRSVGDSELSSVGPVEIRYQISVPEKFESRIKQGGGNIDLSNIAGTSDVVAAAGNLRFEAINGRIHAQTRSGNIVVTNCGDAVDVSAGSGNLRLAGIHGRVVGQTRSGNIQVTECADAVDIKTRSGNLILSGNHGAIACRSGSGNIEVANCDTSLQAATATGNVDVKQFTGTVVNAETGTGNVSARLGDGLKASSVLRTGKGNVSVALSPNAAVNLVATAKVGRVHVEFPVNGSRQRSGNEIHASLNGGGPELRLESTAAGNVHVTKS